MNNYLSITARLYLSSLIILSVAMIPKNVSATTIITNQRRPIHQPQDETRVKLLKNLQFRTNLLGQNIICPDTIDDNIELENLNDFELQKILLENCPELINDFPERATLKKKVLEDFIMKLHLTEGILPDHILYNVQYQDIFLKFNLIPEKERLENNRKQIIAELKKIKCCDYNTSKKVYSALSIASPALNSHEGFFIEIFSELTKDPNFSNLLNYIWNSSSKHIGIKELFNYSDGMKQEILSHYAKMKPQIPKRQAYGVNFNDINNIPTKLLQDKEFMKKWEEIFTKEEPKPKPNSNTETITYSRPVIRRQHHSPAKLQELQAQERAGQAARRNHNIVVNAQFRANLLGERVRCPKTLTNEITDENLNDKSIQEVIFSTCPRILKDFPERATLNKDLLKKFVKNLYTLEAIFSEEILNSKKYQEVFSEFRNRSKEVRAKNHRNFIFKGLAKVTCCGTNTTYETKNVLLVADPFIFKDDKFFSKLINDFHHYSDRPVVLDIIWKNRSRFDIGLKNMFTYNEEMKRTYLNAFRKAKKNGPQSMY